MRLSRLPLSTLLDSASGHLEAHLLQKKESVPPGIEGSAPFSGIIFSGNPHETVPRRLLLDDRLTPLERNTWQVFRLLINDDGLTAFPTYDQLRPYLGMQPGRPASRETVSKALVTLRLTRWLSLGRRVRNDLSGQVQGNVYLLHDEPVTPAEAMEFDKDYLQLLTQSMEHQTKVIREVAEVAWKEFAADPDVGQRLPSRLDVIESRINSQTWVAEQSSGASQAAEFGVRTQQISMLPPLSSATELSKKEGKRSTSDQSSDAELSLKSMSSASVRHPNSYSTYTDTNHDVCKSSVHVPHTPNDIEAELLDALHRLPGDQKQKAVLALQKVPTDLKSALIKQWVHRCEKGSVRNPLGYLMTLVGMAVRGDFNSDWLPEGQTAAETVLQIALNPHESTGKSSKPEPLIRSPESMQTAQKTLSGMLQLLNPQRGTQP
ncbi:STY4528 family pathogenicity island replication protein [Pseudomonas sp. FP597]|uniref:STY4528 family pathogenicity island replication protein n=1 Tax=Pseudomonas sp. FP597 TaxID=2954096 RepID=UPI0027375807|nr:STY4528 family pathogenicity island replication protein [Pseudomonas sp. FP597]WLI07609.1 STY4528 family pathogenicity island replication protein [Pseudomonas sp. FP597]